MHGVLTCERGACTSRMTNPTVGAGHPTTRGEGNEGNA
jgi:hypothetical protein